MVDLLELPDVPLRMVLAYLPVWKLGHLSVQCRRLYKLVQSDYQTRRHLSVLVGVFGNKFTYSDQTETRILDLPDEYDLVIRFEDEVETQYEHVYFKLTADLEQHNIPKMLTCLPNITHLTVVFVNGCPSEVAVEMLSAWPQLESLKLVNHHDELDWSKVAPLISSMCKLEHFMLYTLTNDFRDNREHFDTFIWKGLKTYINGDYPQYKMSESKKSCEIVDRSIWDRPEYAQAVAQFETFGVHNYDILSDSVIINMELLRKLKRVQMGSCLNANFIIQVDWTNWTAIQFLALDIKKVNFSQTFTTLSVLTNLEELNLKVASIQLPKARSCKLWTRLPSVRRFRLVAHLDAHEFYKVANCVPNATNCSLKLWATINVENDGPDEYFARRRTLDGPVCKKCTALMKRAIVKYRTEISSFVWFRQIGKDGKESMVPMVRLFTENVAGSTRFNTIYIPIE